MSIDETKRSYLAYRKRWPITLYPGIYAVKAIGGSGNLPGKPAYWALGNGTNDIISGSGRSSAGESMNVG